MRNSGIISPLVKTNSKVSGQNGFSQVTALHRKNSMTAKKSLTLLREQKELSELFRAQQRATLDPDVR